MKNTQSKNKFNLTMAFASIIFLIATIQTIHYYSTSSDGLVNKAGNFNNIISPITAIAALLFAVHSFNKQNQDGSKAESRWQFDKYISLFSIAETKYETIEVEWVYDWGMEKRIEPKRGYQAFRLILLRQDGNLNKQYEALIELKKISNDLIILTKAVSNKEFEDKNIIVSKLLNFYDINLQGLHIALEEKFNKYITPNSFPPLKESLVKLETEINLLRVNSVDLIE